MATIRDPRSALLEALLRAGINIDSGDSESIVRIQKSSPIPLDEVTSPTVVTADAAHYLNRRPQTLRAWACQDNGPLRPIYINRRLHWSVANIKKLLGSGS